MHGATVSEIPHERDGNFLGLQREVPIDRIRIKERLSGVFPRTVTRIYDRDSRMSSDLRGVSLLIRADSDDIRVSSYDPSRIFQSFTLGDAGELHSRFGNDFSTQPEHGSLERESRTSRRFVEKRCHDAVLGNSRTAYLDDIFHDFCPLEDMVQEWSVELMGGENVAEHK